MNHAEWKGEMGGEDAAFGHKENRPKLSTLLPPPQAFMALRPQGWGSGEREANITKHQAAAH